LEETAIRTPFDHDASSLPQLLRDKWRRLLSPKDVHGLENDMQGTGAGRHAVLWQRIERYVTMPGQLRHEPKPTQG
jgi:hypothetical protein